MGSGSWSPKDWKSYRSAHVDSKSTEEVYSSRRMKSELDPKGVAFRESCDSEDNPNSHAIIVALDVTGSMCPVLDSMARKGLPTLCREIYDRKPVTDPHIMCMGVGDVVYDSSPLQVTQFEADIRIAEQLNSLYLEQGGGGNSWESYNLPWYFAGMHTKIDCFTKRGKKGYLFTMGDECVPNDLAAHQIEQVFGTQVQSGMSTVQALELAQQQYHVFHLIIQEGTNYRAMPDRVDISWREILGQRVIPLKDHTKMAEVIVSTIQVTEGADVDEVVESWDGSTSMVVKSALENMDAAVAKGGGIVEL